MEWADPKAERQPYLFYVFTAPHMYFCYSTYNTLVLLKTFDSPHLKFLRIGPVFATRLYLQPHSVPGTHLPEILPGNVCVLSLL